MIYADNAIVMSPRKARAMSSVSATRGSSVAHVPIAPAIHIPYARFPEEVPGYFATGRYAIIAVTDPRTKVLMSWFFRGMNHGLISIWSEALGEEFWPQNNYITYPPPELPGFTDRRIITGSLIVSGSHSYTFTVRGPGTGDTAYGGLTARVVG